VSKLENQWRIVAGAMPSRAKIAVQASAALTRDKINVDEIATLAAGELVFGTNARATAEYRKAICKVLITRGIREVLQCK